MRTSIAMVALLLPACFGDMVSTTSGPGDGPDAGVAGAAIDPNLEMVCADPQQNADDGHHFEGEACGGCHSGSVASKFTVSGTLYSSVDGSAPLVGATVHIIDDAGDTLELLTAVNGNFYTNADLQFPITTYVSSCPDATAMPFLTDSGDCNGCHDATIRVALTP